MDLCNQFDVHGPSCLYITGINEQYTDKEITDFFKVNGDIKKIVRVPDETARTLVEYSSEWAITRLDPANLGHLSSPNDPNITWHVKTICEVCQEELGRELAQRCLAELSTLAGSSKAGFWSMLQQEFFREFLMLPPSFTTSPPLLNESTINPPQVQKVIVEHFIRSDATPSSFSQSRVRTFSWRLPKPNGMVDYDAWCTQVDLLLNDVSLSDSQKVRRILESLLSPAADIVKPLGTNAPPQA